jgi:hypothetical protein
MLDAPVRDVAISEVLVIELTPPPTCGGVVVVPA